MPIYFNVTPTTVRAIKADGKTIALPSRVDVFIDPSDMSASIQELINKNILRYRGMAASVTLVATPSVAESVKITDESIDINEYKPVLATKPTKSRQSLPVSVNDKRDNLVTTDETDVVKSDMPVKPS